MKQMVWPFCFSEEESLNCRGAKLRNTAVHVMAYQFLVIGYDDKP